MSALLYGPVVCSIASLLIGCGAPNREVGRVGAAPSRGDAVVLEWNAIAVDTLGAQPPFPATRLMAIVQLAVFEAVNAITREYEPYLGTIDAPLGASPEAAAIAAAHGTLKSLFPDSGAALDQHRADSLAKIADGQAKEDGIAVGEAAAAAMIAERADDGSSPPQSFLPTSTALYQWQLTPGCSASGGAFKHWSEVEPFGIKSSSQFRAAAPPALSSKKYAKAYEEVRAVGGSDSTLRPQDRADVARIYLAQLSHIGWNSMARQLANARHDSIGRTARTFALLNMSLSDSHISVFESKYFYTTWRPETAIPRGDEDGNLETTAAAFTPFLASPCFPAYPSAHGAGAGAASEILARAYGNQGHALTNSHPSVPGVVLHYTNVEQVVEDISDARVYGGIHFRFDQDAGEALGRAVARYNLENSFGELDKDDED